MAKGSSFERDCQVEIVLKVGAAGGSLTLFGFNLLTADGSFLQNATKPRCVIFCLKKIVRYLLLYLELPILIQ